jgi:hypothetical protein
MAALTLKTVGASAQEVEETRGWDAAQIFLVSMFGIVILAALLTSVVSLWKTKRRTKQMAAELDNAMAELGAERKRAASLDGRLRRQQAFIDRNVLAGPEAYSAASPEVYPKQSSNPGPNETHSDDLFVVGSDDESSDGDGDDEEPPRSPTPMAAVRVRRSAIKTIDLQPKAVQNQEAGMDATIARGRQPEDNVKDARETPSWYDIDKVEPLEGLDLLLRSQPKDPQAQIDRYWQTDAIDAPRGTSPRLDSPPAEVNPTSTEAGRGPACSNGAGSMRRSIVSSGCSSQQNGPDTPESSMTPSSHPLSGSRGVSPPGFVAIDL